MRDAEGSKRGQVVVYQNRSGNNVMRIEHGQYEDPSSGASEQSNEKRRLDQQNSTETRHDDLRYSDETGRDETRLCFMKLHVVACHDMWRDVKSPAAGEGPQWRMTSFRV